MNKQLLFLTLISTFTPSLFAMGKDEKQVIPFMQLQVNHTPQPSSSNPNPVSFRALELSGQLNQPQPDNSYRKQSDWCYNRQAACCFCVLACCLAAATIGDCCCGKSDSKDVKDSFKESGKMCYGSMYECFCECD